MNSKLMHDSECNELASMWIDAIQLEWIVCNSLYCTAVQHHLGLWLRSFHSKTNDVNGSKRIRCERAQRIYSFHDSKKESTSNYYVLHRKCVCVLVWCGLCATWLVPGLWNVFSVCVVESKRIWLVCRVDPHTIHGEFRAYARNSLHLTLTVNEYEQNIYSLRWFNWNNFVFEYIEMLYSLKW